MEKISQIAQAFNASVSLWSIVLLPLIGSFLAYVLGKQKKPLAGYIATGAAALAFVQVVRLFFELPAGAFVKDILFTWFSLGQLKVDMALRFDHLSAVMCLVITGIGTLIHLYSIGYMSEEKSSPRFFAYLNLFLFAMLLLVLGSNFLVLFVGWEGVGLCSYLLIGFWYTNEDYAKAGRKAFIVNRIGDAGFILGMFLIYYYFKTLEFDVLSQRVAEVVNSGSVQYEWIFLATLFLFIGATGKSAQLPLFVWLPDAMAGPTPVSALIHAATMVTAGIYLLARTHFLFELAPETSSIILVVAGITAFLSAAIALVQNDIKKVLAYSTVSQLGFMFMAAGAGAYWVALFHVVTHAFFKACLFLGAGSVIHGCHHEQDMRHMGGLRKYMPITFVTYLISTIAIAGIFPFAGYFSKHAIMAALQHPESVIYVDSRVFVFLATLTACMTAFYMTRSLIMTFFGEYRGHAHPHESPLTMTIPLMVLAALGLLGGLYLNSQHRFQHYLSAVFLREGSAHASETVVASIIHSWPGLLGIALAILAYVFVTGIPAKMTASFPAFTSLFSAKCYFDEIYATLIINPLQKISNVLWKTVDQNTIDFTVNSTAQFLDINGEALRHVQSGQIRNYALWMFVGTVAILACCFVF